MEIDLRGIAFPFLYKNEVLNEPGKDTKTKSYVWIYRTSVYNTNPVVIYEYTQGRSGAFAKAFLKEWQGTYLHCDGYAGYKKLEDKTLCGCLVHARRKFHEALVANPDNEMAKTGEDYLLKLFAVESMADKQSLSPEERLNLRNEKSKKIIDGFYEWIASTEHRALPQSLVGKAVTYAINQKEYLCNFLKDGRIQLSNNLAEQSAKVFVIGRKNGLFSNTANGANASTLIYSVMQTAIANNLIPQKYLEYVFTRLQFGSEIKDLLPWSDRIPEYCKTKNS